jgi:hypothetical protein
VTEAQTQHDDGRKPDAYLRWRAVKIKDEGQGVE